MAITFRGSAVGGVINGLTPSIDLTTISGLAENDVVCAFVITSAGTIADPGTWTPIISEAGLPGASGVQCAAYYKVMTSSPDTSISFWDSGGSGDSGAAVAMAFIGVDTTTVLDVAATEFESTLAASPEPPAIVPSSDDCAIVIFGGAIGNDASIGTVTDYTQPTPHTTNQNDGSATTAAGAYRILVGNAGVSQDPGPWSTWATVTDSYAVTLALRPAAPVGYPSYYHDGGVRFSDQFRYWPGIKLFRRVMSGLLLPNKPRLIYG